MQCLSLFRLYQRGKLNQPCGSSLRQGLDYSVGIWTASELSDCLEHRIVGFLAAKAFNALSPCCSYIPLMGGLLVKRINQGGLANPRLTGDKYDLPLTTHRSLERDLKRVESIVATHHPRCGVGWRILRVGCNLLTYWSYELISAPGNGFDEYGLVMPVSQ